MGKKLILLFIIEYATLKILNSWDWNPGFLGAFILRLQNRPCENEVSFAVWLQPRAKIKL